jgi:Outer membrane protein beta-barrel domain
MKSSSTRSLSLSLLCAILFAVPAPAQSPFRQGTSTFEAAAGFDYLNTNRVNRCCFGMTGFNGTFAYNANSHLAAVVDVRSFSASNIEATGENLRLTTYMVGPRVALRARRLSPFAQALIGYGHGSSNFPLSNDSAWAGSVGGGVDVRLNSFLSWRAIEVSGLLTHISNGTDSRQNSLQISTGVVFGFGGRK